MKRLLPQWQFSAFFKFLGLQSFLWLLLGGWSFAQSPMPSHIQGFEMHQIGEQLNFNLQISGPVPEYEIRENLSKQTLLVQFKNTLFAIPDGQRNRLVNHPLIEGVRFIEERNELWAQFKARVPNLSFSIPPNHPANTFQIQFRSTIKVPSIPPPLPEPSTDLLGVRMGMHPPDFSRATFLVSQETRILVLVDPTQKHFTLRLSDTRPIPGLKIEDYEDNRIRFSGIETDANQTLIFIDSSTGVLETKERFVPDPPRWVIDFYGEAFEQEEATAETVDTSGFTEEELAAYEKQQKLEAKQKREREKRKRFIRRLYDSAERAYVAGRYSSAINLFQKAYAKHKQNMGEFEDEPNTLAIQGLFRVASSIYKILERKEASNYHQAIEAYRTALRVAKKYDFKSDLLPNAHFQIGRSYQKMQFFHEANLEYAKLQKEYPGSLEAGEANFWRAVTQVSRREWRQAIVDFREYLRAPSPRHLAAAHYKLSEAYYNLGNYTRAREGFDRARAIDSEYPKDDPTLLFRMGETYYENADFPTAREVFQILLDRYPKADFSKLVSLRMGDFLRDEGREDEAIAVYENAISQFSLELTLLAKMRIANIYAERPYSDDHKKAIDTYTEVIERYPDSSLVEEAHLRKALTQTLFGYYLEALPTLESFAKQYPENPYSKKGVIRRNIDENLKGLINYYFQKEDYLGVVGVYQDYQQYFSNFPDDVALFQVAVSYQKLGLFAEALDLFKFLSNQDKSPLQVLSRFQEAVALAEKPNFPRSREAFLRFIRDYDNSPYDADVKKHLAQVYKRNGQYEEAVQVYEQAIRQYTKERNPLLKELVPELYYEVGNLYNTLGHYTNAAKSYAQVIETYDHPVVGDSVPFYVMISHFLEADTLFNLKRDPEALEAYEQALRLYQNHEDPDIQERVYWARYQMGLIHQRAGREQQALTLFKGLINENVQDDPVPLWKRLATESYDVLSRKMAYEQYLRN